MIEFSRLFTNPLHDPKISLTLELDYGAAQLSRMVANNPGNALDGRIAATTVALAALEGGVTDEGTKLAVQMARTQAKTAFRASLAPQLARVHAAVVAVFGSKGSETVEIFPRGRRIFARCRDEELDNQLEALLACLAPKQAQVGAVAVTLATNLKNNWAALYGAQNTAMAQKEATAQTRNAARAALKRELFKNLLTLALMFPDEPEKCALYCPQHLLRNRQSAGETEPVPPPTGT